VWCCCGQALEKLLLAEGSKMVMVAFQSSYSQGVYGLVSNLGSLVVRTIFQVCPFFLQHIPLSDVHSTSFYSKLPGLLMQLLVVSGSAKDAVLPKDLPLAANAAWPCLAKALQDQKLFSQHSILMMRVQPFEEAAFLAFSRSEPELSAKDAAAQRSRVLAVSVRCVTVVGEPSHVKISDNLKNTCSKGQPG
jgi:hypothetical protein